MKFLRDHFEVEPESATANLEFASLVQGQTVRQQFAVYDDDANLYGTIQISPFEAENGAQKLVNIPWGFHNRLFRVGVPPGTQSGSRLRLRGLGRQMPNGQGSGDLRILLYRLHFPQFFRPHRNKPRIPQQGRRPGIAAG